MSADENLHAVVREFELTLLGKETGKKLWQNIITQEYAINMTVGWN